MTALPKHTLKKCPFRVGDVVDVVVPRKGWPYRGQGVARIELVLGPEDLIELEDVCRFNGPRTKIGQKSGCFRVVYTFLNQGGFSSRRYKWLTESSFKVMKKRKETA